MTNFAQTTTELDMEAYFNASLWPAERRKLANLANSASGECIIEIGVFRGETTKYLAENTNKIIIAIDPYEMSDNDNEKIREYFYTTCAEHLKSGKIIHIPRRSVDAHENFTPDMVNNCAMVFVDWNGNVEDHIRDFNSYHCYLSKDGYLVAHDFFDDGTLNKHRILSEAIIGFTKKIDKPITWESMLYYPKHSEMDSLMTSKGGTSDFFYHNRSRGLVWCKPKS